MLQEFPSLFLHPPITVSTCVHKGKGLWWTSLVPRPFTKIRARVNACAREGEKGLVNNYASPRAKAGMLEQVLVCKH